MKNNKSIISILVTVICLIFLTAMGSYALFNAKKTISTNKFSAGTLDLDVSSTGNINQPISIDNVGGSGKIDGSRTWTVKNIGTLPGKLIFNLQNINNLENGCNAPEIEAEPNCESDNTGELGQAITINAQVDGVEVAQSTLQNGHDFSYNKVSILQPNDSVELVINWQESDVGYGNEIQSDTTNFDMTFRLEQQ